MAGVVQIPRSRGGICGLLLLLLGAWGGLIPFVGPYFHYAYTPDKAWAYTAGRLYLSILPGAAALLGGLLILLTRSRAAGVFGGLLAAVGGIWFIVGYSVILVFLKDNTTISPGTPIDTSTGVTGQITIRMFIEELGFFTGLGILIVFIAAIAIGRFSMIAARDVSAGGAGNYDSFGGGPAGQEFPSPLQDPPSGQQQFPTVTGQFPSAQEKFPAAPGQFPPPAQDFPTTTGRFPSSAETQVPTTSGQFPPATERFPPPAGQFPTSGG